MGHHHDEHHGHGSHELSFAEKGAKLLDHWIQHNTDHLGSYRRWVMEFRTHQHAEVADLLESVVELTEKINETLNVAAKRLSSRDINQKG